MSGRLCLSLRKLKIISGQFGILSITITHPYIFRTTKKKLGQAIGRSKGGLTTKIHATCTDDTP
jgi:hypothetical protein